MKLSEYQKILRMAKGCLEEYISFGEYEVPFPANKQDIADNAVVKLSLDEFKNKISNCKKCSLGETRLNFVFGVGNPKAKLMFVGEGPGFDEDHKGEPFIGRAGKLLNDIIKAMGMTREAVYIANIVKCHPMIDPSDQEKHGNDRPPTIEEAMQCLPYLNTQIDIIKPKVICALGSSSAKRLLNTELTISNLRGRFYDYRGIKLMPTFHPAALLRNPVYKKDVWQDMKQIMKLLGI